MRFGKKLKEHVSTQTLPKECYVDYKGLKAAIKSGCSASAALCTHSKLGMVIGRGVRLY